MKLVNDIMSMKRGDDENLIVSIKDRPFSAGDTVIFNLRQLGKKILQYRITDFTEAGAAVFAFDSIDTMSLPIGEYMYDIHIEWADGTHYTPLGPALFVLEEGGYHGA